MKNEDSDLMSHSCENDVCPSLGQALWLCDRALASAPAKGSALRKCLGAVGPNMSIGTVIIAIVDNT